MYGGLYIASALIFLLDQVHDTENLQKECSHLL